MTPADTRLAQNGPMRQLVIRLGDDTFSALARLALVKRRPVRDQAAVLLERALDGRLGRGTPRPLSIDETPPVEAGQVA